jgi:hypothetical protein
VPAVEALRHRGQDQLSFIAGFAVNGSAIRRNQQLTGVQHETDSTLFAGRFDGIRRGNEQRGCCFAKAPS